jgi:iron complex transport system ATP-binding protein
MEMDVILKDLAVGYKGRTLVTGANAVFGAGTLTALVGRNGTGKSTLLRVMAGLAKPLSGEILFDLRGKSQSDPQPLSTLSPHHLARLTGFVSTHRPRVPNLRARDVVALGRTPYTDWIGNLTPDDHNAIDRALEVTGTTTFASKPLDTLSDGEAQRVMIARAVAQNTPVILLDEPTAFLDFVARREVCELLRHLACEAGKTVVFSSHELALVDEFAHHKLTLTGGNKIIFE